VKGKRREVIEGDYQPHDNLTAVLIAMCVKVSELMTTTLRQRFEYQADAFATTLTDAAHLRSGLVKLHRDNLGFPMCDWLYARWYLSHPPLVDRLVSIA